MDTAVALVQDYLSVNGYFSVVEYPVLEAYRDGSARSVTDLDVLAVRFSGAGHEVIRGKGRSPMGGHEFEPDPALRSPPDRADMIVGEVKEGPAPFNSATRDPEVLGVALARFGCCERVQVRPWRAGCSHAARSIPRRGTPSGWWHSVRWRRRTRPLTVGIRYRCATWWRFCEATSANIGRF